MDPLLNELLSHWLPAQRWFPAKGNSFELDTAAVIPVQTTGNAGTIVVLAVRAPENAPVLIQVPLLLTPVPSRTTPATHHPAPAPAGRSGEASPAAVVPTSVIGRLVSAEPGRHPLTADPLAEPVPEWLVADACQDPGFVGAVLGLMRGNHEIQGPVTLTGHRGPDVTRSAALAEVVNTLNVNTSEQSNTSVIINAAAQGVILKFFRTLTEGRNPEVELGEVLTRLQAWDVPGTLGWLSASTQQSTTDLAVAHEFLPGGRDAWTEAVSAAVSGRSFARQAHAMGQGTARIHRRLADGLPAGADAGDISARLVARVRESWSLVAPTVGSFDAEVESILAGLAATSITTQRIHGDLHLGQLLGVNVPGSASGNGSELAERWVFLDFEGEPLRPVAERVNPDVPLRDVVGMLRSFDYASGAATHELRASGGGEVPTSWVEDCTEAFLAGYASVVPGAPAASSPLFRALMLDKALYEVRYELANRPDWLSIPLDAVRRMLTEVSGSSTEGTP